MPPLRILVPVVLVAGSLLWVFASGGREERAGLDRGNAHAVFLAAMRAVHDADWPVLEELLTKDARFTLERDLRRLRARLAHPEDGKREREVARERLGERYEAELQRAIRGGMADALRFFVLLSPRAREPATKGAKMGPFEMQFLYESGGGVVRPVKLRRVGADWFVAELHL